MGPVSRKLFRLLVVGLLAISVIACSSNARAPVGERSPYKRPNPGLHTVKRGESLYSISWQYGLDYQTVARWNGIKPPYTIHAGQKILLKPTSQWSAAKPAPSSVSKSPPRSVASKPVEKPKTQQIPQTKPQYPQLSQSGNIAFIWPNKGQIIKSFNASDEGKTGISIGGSHGAKIQAAAAGKVVYAGSGLVGYGRLIIVKHNAVFLSAYAHNDRILVREGDWVAQGQTIATMGSTGTSRVMLHFEIRRHGKPVNPLGYLPRK